MRHTSVSIAALLLAGCLSLAGCVVVPAHRVHVWVPGHWASHHVWVEGHWRR
jgi:hypothetical protein